MRERSRLKFIAIIDHQHHTPSVSELPFDGDGDDHVEAGRRQLLEMYELRQRVERGAVANGSGQRVSMALRRARIVREPLEPIAPATAVEPRISRGAQ